MTNPLDSIALYKVQDGQEHYIITLGRTRSGAWAAYHGYGTKRIARAGGYGYDKRSTALNAAIAFLTGKPSLHSGAEGESFIIADWATRGVRVVNVLDIAITL